MSTSPDRGGEGEEREREEMEEKEERGIEMGGE